MAVKVPSVIFFDIGDTLGSVRLSLTSDRIERITVLPHVFEALEELTDMGTRLGIISNRGEIPENEVNRALKNAGLYKYFEPSLIMYGRKDSPAIFIKSAAQAGLDHLNTNCLFVGENESERQIAATAGFLTAATAAAAPTLVSQLISGKEP